MYKCKCKVWLRERGKIEQPARGGEGIRNIEGRSTAPLGGIPGYVLNCCIPNLLVYVCLRVSYSCARRELRRRGRGGATGEKGRRARGLSPRLGSPLTLCAERRHKYGDPLVLAYAIERFLSLFPLLPLLPRFLLLIFFQPHTLELSSMKIRVSSIPIELSGAKRTASRSYEITSLRSSGPSVEREWGSNCGLFWIFFEFRHAIVRHLQHNFL